MTGLRRRGLQPLIVAVLLGVLAPAGAAAQTCGQFAWSSDGRVDLFAGSIATFQSGDTLPAVGIFSVALRPHAELIYPVRSGGAGDGGYGGMVTFENIAAGRYRVALAGEARIEAVQLYGLLPSRTVAWDPECPGEYQRIEITAEDGPLTLQIVGARTSRLTLAVYRRWYTD